MEYQVELRKNVILQYIEDNTTIINKNNREVIESFSIYFSFYGKSYRVDLFTSTLKSESPNIGLYGDSDLFESFKSLCEIELWDDIVKYSNNFIEEYEELYNE